jgi:Family of unknown function (DUF6188)
MAFKDGRLDVYFEDGSVIRVSRTDQGEVWRIEAEGRGRIIARSGGIIARWPDGPDPFARVDHEPPIGCRSRAVRGCMLDAARGVSFRLITW